MATRDPWAGMRDPWAGMREVRLASPSGGGAGMSMGAGPVAPRPPMRQPTPFHALMEPNAPGIFGLLGRLANNPTREEHLLEKSGLAQAGGLVALQERLMKGVPAQQAVMEWLQSPEGQDMFIYDPDAMGKVQSVLEQFQPSYEKLSANETLLEVGKDGATPLYTAPSEKVNTFNALAEIGALSDEEKATIARTILDAEVTGDLTEKERAFRWLVQNGLASQETAQRFLSGTLDLKPLNNQFNNPIGYILTDALQGTNIHLPTGRAETQSPVPQQPVGGELDKRAAALPPGASIQTLRDMGINPAAAVRYVGPEGMLRETGGTVMGWFNPEWSGQEARAARDMLRQIRFDATQMRDAGDGRLPVAELNILTDMIDLMGVGQNSVQAAQSILSWRNFLEQRLAMATAQSSNMKTSVEERQKAEAELHSVKKALLNLPEKADLMAEIEKLRSEGATLPRLMKEGGEVLEQAPEAITGGDTPEKPEKKAPAKTGVELPTFATEDEAIAAHKAGKIRLRPGMVIIIDGKEITVED